MTRAVPGAPVLADCLCRKGNIEVELNPEKSHVASQWAHERPLIACRFSPDGEYVFCGSEDAVVTRFRLSDGAKTAFLNGHKTWVKAITFSADGSHVITGGYDGQLTWWETAADAPTPIRQLPAHGTHWIRELTMAPDGQQVASCGNDCAVRLWHPVTGAAVGELLSHEKHIYSVTYDPAGERLFSGDLSGKICEWNLSSKSVERSLDGKELWSFNTGQKVDFGGIRSLACSADGKWLAAGGLYKASNPLGAVHEPLVLLFNLETGKIERKWVAEGISRGVVWRVRWLSDGSLVGVCGGGNGGFLLFWKPDAEKDYFRLKLPNIARDMDLHPDGLRIATAHHDKNVRITLMSDKQS